MLNEIKNFLSDANLQSTKLYFLEKDKDNETGEIKYKSLKTEIDTEMSSDLVSTGFKQMDKLLKKDIEEMDYGVLPYSDKTQVEVIDKNEVPFLNIILEQLASGSLSNFNPRKTSKMHGYILKIENSSEKALLLFKKQTSKKLFEKGKISAVLDDDKISKFNKEVVTFEEQFDAALLLKAEEGYLPKVYVFNRSQFESMFSFADYYKNKISSNRGAFEEKGIVDDSNRLIDFCGKNCNMIRKLARTLENGVYEGMEIDRIRDCCSNFSISDVSFNSDGKIIVTEDNIWTILRILDDDHVLSDVTSLKYEARSKIKKT